MTDQAKTRNVTITVSKPYTLIGGGYTSLRPLGRRRDYIAEIDGVTYKNTSKSEITTLIRHRLHPVRPLFTFENK